MNKQNIIDEILDGIGKLSPVNQAAMLAFLQINRGEVPTNPLAVLTLNRHAIKIQAKGDQLMTGVMPNLAALALQIIDDVADLEDRRVLMSYYWHAEDVHNKKIPDVLKRNGFTPA